MRSNKLRKTFKSFLFEDESGQAVVEYVVVLLIAVSLFLTVYKELITPAYRYLSETIMGNLENKFMSYESMHSIRLSM